MYEALTMKECAALAFRYMVELNDLELERIEDTVPLVNYRLRNLEYLNWHDRFCGLAHWWTVNHWQLQWAVMAATVACLSARRKHDYQQADQYHARLEQAEWRLIALDCALDAICREHGLAAEAVRSLASTQPYSPLHGITGPDSAFQEWAQGSLRSLLD
jgi:hypothetical protein